MEECIERVRVYTGRLINLNVDKVKLPNGRITTREYVQHRGAVAAIPLLPDGKIVLVRQYRYPVSDYLLEIPAGTIEKGEKPEETMERELVEEIGYFPGKLQMIAHYYSSPGFVNEEMFVYVAEGLEKMSGEKDPEENIEIFEMPIDEAIDMLMKGKIKDGKTIVALSLYALSRRYNI